MEQHDTKVQFLMTDSASDRRLIYFLPCLSLATDRFRVASVTIGQATFLKDEDEAWTTTIQFPRPRYLDVFKCFPDPDVDEEPETARGTVLIAEDDEWLEDNVEALVALLYVLGQPSDRWKAPAERFRYHGFRISKESCDTFRLATKKGDLIEDSHSVVVMPSLYLRGEYRPYKVSLADETNKKLIQLFHETPDDRLVTGARHLFRAQFSDPFSAPVDQDYTSYGACLEAVLDIGGEGETSTSEPTLDVKPSPFRAWCQIPILGRVLTVLGFCQEPKDRPRTETGDIGKRLGRQLIEIYPDLAELDEWVQGLYACCVKFVHGLSNDASFRVRQRQLYEAFLARRGNRAVLNDLCVDLIRERLQTSEPGLEQWVAQLLDSKGVRLVLESFFKSDELFRQLKTHLGEDKAADAILTENDDTAKSEFFRVCLRFVSDHRWQFTQTLPQEAGVFRMIVTLCLLIVKDDNASADDKRAVSELGDYVDKKDGSAVRNWHRSHRSWKGEFSADEWLPIYKSVIAHLAAYFQHLNRMR